MEKARKVGRTVPNMRETTKWAKNMVKVLSSGRTAPNLMASSYQITSKGKAGTAGRIGESTRGHGGIIRWMAGDTSPGLTVAATMENT